MRIALAAVLLAAACGSSTKQPVAQSTPQPTTPTAPAQTAPEPAPEPVATVPSKPVTNKSLASIGLDPDAMDKSVDPCDDFYQFACGGWIAKNEVPADKPLTMRSFIAIDDRNLDYEHDMLERARKSAGDDPVLQKLGSFYGACMDEASIAQAGIKPLRPLLDVINGVKDAKSLSKAIAVLHGQGFDDLFVLGPTQDSADARNVIAGIDQGGIGLPDRDYYLQDDDSNKKLRAAYSDMVVKLLTAAGHKNAKAEADDIIALETAIAKVSKDKVARRDPKGTYNKLDREGVAKAMPHFDWDTFWKTVGLKDVKDVTVTSPEFLAGIDPLLTSVKPETWRAYLTAALMRHTAPYLNKELEEARFALISAMSGQQQQEPRWKRCASFTDAALGDLLGQAFVKDKFSGASKSAAEEQVHAIVDAMGKNLAALPWMDAATKQKAATKLAAMTYQIGYPKHWKTYAFAVDSKAFARDALAATKAENSRQLAKIGRPVDKDDWQMTTPTVNAYYDPQLNGMVFPAGILQPPFYNVDSAIAVNLGAMGVVVGHELTHGFDDQGAQFDADGNLKDWWQPETEKLFKQRTKCVIDEYSQFDVGTAKVNGARTVGENIADIGGVKLALAGYRALRSTAPDTVVADGYTEDQQFFLSFGQAWCAKARPDYERMQVTVDPHSPARWRVNGALSATPDFAKAWSCKKGVKKLAPANQCVVW